MQQVLCPIVVGRAAELDELASVVDFARPAVRLAAVSGEAGVGKTRLLEAARERAESHGAEVLWGACLEQYRSLPYAALGDALRGVVGDGDPRLRRLVRELDPAESEPDSEAARYLVAHALAAFLAERAAVRPVVLVLEDLHWADAATLDLLPILARRLDGPRAAVLLSYRSDEPADAPGLIADLARRRLAGHVALDGLDAAAVEAMLRAMLTLEGPISDGFVAAIHRRSDGNPLFVEELVRTLIETGDVFRTGEAWERRALDALEVPPTIEETILRRTRDLPSDSAELLRTAAVLGQRFELEALAAVAGLGAEAALAALRPLVTQQLVLEERGTGAFRFRHALTRDAVYGRLLVVERRLLHARVADGLLRLHAAALDERAAELAHHLAAAGETARAAELAERAAERAVRIGALVDARTHMRTAARLAATPAERARLLRAAGDLSFTTGDLRVAIEELGESAALYEALGDLSGRVDALLELSRAILMDGDRAGAVRVRDSVLGLLEPLGESAQLAAAYRMFGSQAMLAGDHPAAERWSVSAIVIGRRTGADEIVIEASIDLGTSLAHREPESGLPRLRDALARARATGLPTTAGRAYVNLSNALILLCRYEEALALCEEGIAYCRDAGSHFMMRIAQTNRTVCLRLLGRWAEAERQGAEILEAAEELGSRKYALAGTEVLTELRADQGRWEDAAALCDRLEPLAYQRDELQHVGPARTLRARILAARGADDEALAELEALRAYWHERSDDPAHVLAALALAYQLGGSAAVLRDLEIAAERSPSPEARAYLAEASGDAAEAAAAWSALGRPYDRARALRLLGESHLARGEREAAVGPLVEAVEIAQALGAAHELELATAALRRAGVRGPRPATRSGPGGLTARELDVARLIADGRTNPEIAAALVVSPRTVDAHVRHILAKLEFGSRAQIARWAAEHELVPR
jgi:DNA-binding NarL/FixJ family response regulator